MPGPIVHLQTVRGLAPYLREIGGDRGRELADLLDADTCSPYTGLGAQGPDFLLFSLTEYGTPLDELVNFLFGVYDALEPFVDFYEQVVAPVEQAVDDAVTAADQALFNGLLGDIGATADLIANALLAQLQKVVAANIDLFYPFRPKIQQGAPEDQWYWFDTWHYRRTGRLASTMWQLAQGDDDLMRYVVGYGSHIGCDVAGHPFVNAVVGGPYRSFWHRHHLVENWMDAYARTTYPDDRRTRDCLRIGRRDTYLPDSIAGSYYYRLCEFPDGRLPDKLADMLVQAVDLTFAGTRVPPALTAADYDSTYRLWLAWFERSTTIGAAQKPTPVPPPGAAAAALFTDYVSGFPPPPGFGGGGGGGGFSLASVFAAIAAFAEWIRDVVAYTVGWALAHAADIVALPHTEALAFVKWLLYQIRKGVWQIYEEARFALVLGAYLSPEPRDLARYPWGTAFLTTSAAHLTGGPSPSFTAYPHKEDQHGLFGPLEHHLVYPGTPVERLSTEAAPKPFYGRHPDVVLDGFHPYDHRIEDLYTAKDPYGSGPAFTHWTDEQTWDGHQLGSVKAFSARLLSTHLDDLPNFNLDADRGYGWKTWVPDRPDIEAQNPVPVRYVDP